MVDQPKRNPLRAALKYAELGWQVIPVHWLREDGACSCNRAAQCSSTAKHPLLPDWVKAASINSTQINQWWSRWPMANVGIVTGKASGVFVLDRDDGKGGADSLAELEQKYGELPATITAITGGGGRHYFFRYPDGMNLRNSVDLLGKGLDIRSDGGFVVAAPSMHRSGNIYRWEDGRSPLEVQPANAPAWLIEALARPSPKSAASQASDPKVHVAKPFLPPPPANAMPNKIPMHSRNATLTSVAGSMRARGMSYDAIYAALLKDNEQRCDLPLDPVEVQRIAHSISRYAPATQERNYHRTDTGNAERLRDAMGENFRYCPAFKDWFVYNGRYWKRDTGEMTEYAIQNAKEMLLEASVAENASDFKDLAKHAFSTESNSRLNAMLSIAACFRDLVINADALDADAWKLNVRNGVVDLLTGKLLPHRREYMMSKICEAGYDPLAQAPLWMSFLDLITDGNAELQRYLQKVAGSCLSGDTSEQALFILYGQGANGKSTFINMLADILGDGYAKNTKADTFMTKTNDSQSNDIARLQGARLVTAIENDAGKKLSEALVKSLTGGDKLTARYLYGEFFDYRPQFKVFLAVNHRPIIRDSSHSIWRRIKLIPFLYTIPEDKRDKQFPQKLKAESEGILAWAVQGCLLWQKEGLDMPVVVEEATSVYKTDMDMFGRFFEECCYAADRERTPHKVLYAALEVWCRSVGEFVPSNKLVTNKLRERGYESRRSGAGGNTVWYGFGVREEALPLMRSLGDMSHQ